MTLILLCGYTSCVTRYFNNKKKLTIISIKFRKEIKHMFLQEVEMSNIKNVKEDLNG